MEPDLDERRRTALGPSAETTADNAEQRSGTTQDIHEPKAARMLPIAGKE
jgi:hypothetical protein